jgi:transposase
MKAPPIQRIDLEMDEINALLERAHASMEPDDYTKLKALVETAVYLLEVVEDKRTTIDRLRKMLFGAGSEKTRDVIPPPPASPSPVPESVQPAPPVGPEADATVSKPPGHGRNGADAYKGAEKVPVPHESLKRLPTPPPSTSGGSTITSTTTTKRTRR